MAAGISFVLALGAVTALEHSAGKSLTCWVWEDCPAESSSADDEPSEQQSKTTLPSILGGGPSVGNEAAGVGPAVDGGIAPEQRPTPNDLGAPGPPPAQASSEPAGSGGTDSGAAGWSGQQQSPSNEQQEASYYYSHEEYEEPTSNISSSSSVVPEEDQNGAPPGTEDKNREGYDIPLVPWTT